MSTIDPNTVPNAVAGGAGDPADGSETKITGGGVTGTGTAADPYVFPEPPANFAQVVYVDTATPATATIFDLANPPATNDDALKNLDSAVYIGSDGSTWTSNGTAYSTFVPPDATEWFLAGTTTDAAGSKTANIYRKARVLLSLLGSAVTAPLKALHLQLGGTSGIADSGDGMLISSSQAGGARIYLEHTGAPAGQKSVIIYTENGLTRIGIPSDDGATWVVQNSVVVRNNGGPVAGAVGIRNASPVSHLDSGGSFGANIEKDAVATHGMVATSHTYISQVGNTAVTLPPPSTNNIRRFYIVKRVPTATTPTQVLGHIDDVASATLDIQPGQARTFQCDGTTWWVV